MSNYSYNEGWDLKLCSSSVHLSENWHQAGTHSLDILSQRFSLSGLELRNVDACSSEALPMVWIALWKCRRNNIKNVTYSKENHCNELLFPTLHLAHPQVLLRLSELHWPPWLLDLHWWLAVEVLCHCPLTVKQMEDEMQNGLSFLLRSRPVIPNQGTPQGALLQLLVQMWKDFGAAQLIWKNEKYNKW